MIRTFGGLGIWKRSRVSFEVRDETLRGWAEVCPKDGPLFRGSPKRVILSLTLRARPLSLNRSLT